VPAHPRILGGQEKTLRRRRVHLPRAGQRNQGADQEREPQPPENPKVCLPKWADWGEILRWCLQENVPGEFPYTAGVFPFKREGEDPTRMFAGEGGPERTNRRFHYVSRDARRRLSTAFDSVTLYGEDPDYRPIFMAKLATPA
jgi:methylmalonyl-CoA mutase N-terminal domain/subunit